MSQASLTLSELNRQVKDAIRTHLPETYWMRGETSDVRRNRNGHCYLEFIEKDAVTQSIIAKARGVIWSNVFQMLSAYFENETGQQFTSGMNVLVRVSVEFHELYGYSLTVVDIDPSFTLGEIARNRQLVLKQLEEEGVLTLNRELALPELTNRVAVISSPTAAGYEDFCDQLANNPGGLVFYSKLFPAIMQGDRSEASIIAALEKIFQYRDLFDAVAIIRGGGASSDLSCFDSYLLATNVAQFPLPVISGIGHERDVTVLDIVAHTRAKTPTAVAEFFIARLTRTATELISLEERMVSESGSRLLKEQTDLFSLSKELVHQSSLMVQKEMAAVQQLSGKMKYGVRHLLQHQSHVLENRAQFIQMVSPVNILKRGYTLTLKDRKIITSLQGLSLDDVIETRFRDGSSTSVVTGIKKPEE
ncbi:MAG: exodeoxyribonuclease VII large subunit [Proteiniphilum sp.]|jgi:exodeoxyribonuclease VII large subunit|uniref:exodeoxyribonuclease VII large subunit n=1 Tax=Proteiniphilum sp. TaxID=1926877 RepID=UPI002B1FF62C|nr:exodeoxyribonuclease VII large subunit [Proteiniphilum sp.]MEA5127645.1 exodeoxyribonuclease VII large subunit [Proteiniphilum sp.]